MGYNGPTMIGDLFSTLIFEPLYNGLIGLVGIIPGGDVGFAVILLTIAVKLILFPLSLKAVRTQLLMRELQEPLKALQEKYKNDRQQQGVAILALYREKGVNPFSSILLLFIQLPIIFGLYWVFFKGGLPEIHYEWLYDFMREPAVISMMFLGLVDMAGRSLVLSFLAGATQFIQAKLSFPPLPPKEAGAEPDFKDDLQRSLQLQMKYGLPILVAVISYTISSAVALYWVTSNIFTIMQELYVRRTIKAPHEAKKQAEAEARQIREAEWSPAEATNNGETDAATNQAMVAQSTQPTQPTQPTGKKKKKKKAKRK